MSDNPKLFNRHTYTREDRTGSVPSMTYANGISTEITLRDLFMGLAMMGYNANPESASRSAGTKAAWCAEDADAMSEVFGWRRHGLEIYRCAAFARDGDSRGCCTIYENRPPVCSEFPYGRVAVQHAECSWYVRIFDFEPVQG